MLNAAMKNLFHIPASDLSGTEAPEIFEALIKTPGLLVERIISRGQVTPEGEWYDQELDEWVALISGHAIIRFEPDERIELAPGDYLLIPAHRRHRVEYTSVDPACIWLAIHGNL